LIFTALICLQAANRVLTVLGSSMNHEQIDAIYGARIAEFCGAREGYAVQLDQIG
jgi:hypothetical protein